MKNKKILATALIITFSVSNLPLQAAGNQALSTFEYTDGAPLENSHNLLKKSWFEKHRNKALLVLGSIIALCAGAYALHTSYTNEGSSSKKGNGNENVPLQGDYTELCKGIEALSTIEGTGYNKIHKAGIELPGLDALATITTAPINKNIPYKLAVIKLALSKPEDTEDTEDTDIINYVRKAIDKVGHTLASLQWPTAVGKLTGKQIEESSLASTKLQELSLDQLIDTTLPAMVKAARTKVDAALNDACERSGKDANAITLSNVYQPDTKLTAQDALAELTRTPQPFVFLQRAQRLIDVLSSFENRQLATLKGNYEKVLEEYKNATREGSLYDKMLREVGIDLLSEKPQEDEKRDEFIEILKWLQSLGTKKAPFIEPDTIASYEKAAKDLHDKIAGLTIQNAWNRVTEQAYKLSLLTWPKEDNSPERVGQEVAHEVFNNCPDGSTIGMFEAFKENLAPLVTATLTKVDAALAAANTRLGKDQNDTLLPNVDAPETSPISVQEALTNLKKSKPFIIMQHAPQMINTLATLSNNTLKKLKNDLKEAFSLMLRLTSNGSAYSKAAAAQIPELPRLEKMPKNREKRIIYQKSIEDQIDFEFTGLQLQEKLQECNKLIPELQETAITARTREKIGEIVYSLDARIDLDPLFRQDLRRKSLDELIHNVIPSMVTALLTKIDKSIKILSESPKIEQAERDQIIEAINKIRSNKTYATLEIAVSFMNRLYNLSLRN